MSLRHPSNAASVEYRIRRMVKLGGYSRDRQTRGISAEFRFPFSIFRGKHAEWKMKLKIAEFRGISAENGKWNGKSFFDSEIWPGFQGRFYGRRFFR